MAVADTFSVVTLYDEFTFNPDQPLGLLSSLLGLYRDIREFKVLKTTSGIFACIRLGTGGGGSDKEFVVLRNNARAEPDRYPGPAGTIYVTSVPASRDTGDFLELPVFE